MEDVKKSKFTSLGNYGYLRYKVKDNIMLSVQKYFLKTISSDK